MNNNKEFSWYKLINVKGLGSKSLLVIYNVIAKQKINVEEIFQLSEQDFYSIFPNFGTGKFSKIKYQNFKTIDEEKLYNSYEELQNKNIKLIPISHESYPTLIKKRLKIDSPPILYCKGAFNLLSSNCISIVGSRNANESTLLLTKNIAATLTKAGYNIVSGYAKGVDTNAHLGALEIDGTTSVILPLGIKNYSIKREFRGLNWEKNTLFISQFLPAEKWRARNAMTRNKIVASLSDAIVIITSGPEKDEKGRMSGTFDAGKSSLEMGIPVFVLSPSVFSDPPVGNSDLIRLGGIEIKSGDDILYHLYNFDESNFIPIQSNSNNQLSLNME